MGKIFGWAAVCAVTVFTTLITVNDPAISMSIIVLLGFMVWAILHPYTAACTLAFLTAAFPKAGIKVADFPFPIFLFGLLFALVLITVKKRAVNHSAMATLATAMFIFWVIIRAIIFSDNGPGPVAAFLAWTAIPLVMLYMATRVQDDVLKFRRSIEAGFLIAVGYGLLQFAFGIEAVAIPGLTHALGDDILHKNNVIYSELVDYSKIPATYQHGNIFGLVAAVFLALAMQRIVRRSASRMDTALLIAGATAVALSGSRTAIVASVVALAVLLLTTGRLAQKVGVLAVLGVAGVAVMAAQPQLLDRYSVGDLAATGGAGRSEIWGSFLSYMTPTEFWFGTERYWLTEGWLGVVMQIGIVGTFVLCLSILLLLKRRRGFGIAVLVLLVGAIIDASYQLFPTWFLIAALAAADPLQNVKSQPDHEVGPGLHKAALSDEMATGPTPH